MTENDVLTVPPLETWPMDDANRKPSPVGKSLDRPLVEHFPPTHRIVWLYMEFPNDDGFPTDGAGDLQGTAYYEIVPLLAYVIKAENGPTTLWHPLVGEIGQHYTTLDELKREELAVVDAEIERLQRRRQRLITDANSLHKPK